MADGEVRIDVTLDTSGVESGARTVKGALDGIGDEAKGASEGIDRASGSLGEAGGSAERASQSVSTLASVSTAATTAGSAMTSAVTDRLKGLGQSAVSLSADFEQTMSSMQAMTGSSAESMQQLSDYAVKMGADTVFSAGEAADAMLELSKGGVSNQDIMDGVLESTLKLATVGDMGLADASTVASSAMHQFGLSAADTDQIVVALAGAANASQADVGSLGEALGNCGTVASAAGWSLQDTSAVLAEFSDAGIDGAEAGTQLKSMLMQIQKPSDSAKAVMDQYGISLYNADGTMKSASEVADTLQKALGGLTDEQRNAALSTIFGTYAVNGANIMMRNGSDGLRKYQDATEDAAGTQDLFASKMSGTKGAMEVMEGSIETAKLQLGDALAPAIQVAAAAVGKLADAFSALPAGAKTAIAMVGVGVAMVGPALKAVGAVSAGLAVVRGALSRIGGAGRAAGKALSGVGSAAKAATPALDGVGTSATRAGGGLDAGAGGARRMSRAAGSWKTVLSYAAAIAAVGAAVLMAGAGFRLMAEGAAEAAQSEAGVAALAVMAGSLVALMAVAGAVGPRLSGAAPGLLAFGAACLMAGAGLALVADGAAQVAQQGPLGIAALAVMVAGTIALAAAFALLGPGLAVAAAPMLAFGAAVLMVGAAVLLAGQGIGAMCSGVAALVAALASACQALPLVAQYGAQAGASLVALAAGVAAVAVVLPGLGAGAGIAGAGLLVLAGGMAATGAAATLLSGGLSSLADLLNRFGVTDEEIGDGVTAVWTGVGDTLGGVVGDLEGLFAGLADSISRPFRDAAQGIRDLWNGTVGGRTIGIPAVGPFGGASVTIPALARGGVITAPTLALAGEAGPEAVVPLSSPQAGRWLGGGTDLSEVTALLRAILDKRSDVLIDGRALVGEIAGAMDQELGRRATNARRGV